ncbi:phage shock protein operon transcriptional activator [Oleidesulfovibrio sp.]|uniref:phage shock protein operon transcriptional activator n=1 Tax=Oleidesulfovibrio sp. TaxID=2909707 RepID=UPI003A84728F
MPKPAPPHAAHVEALGNSDVFLAFQERVSRAARVDRPVLLLGERGTGKELAAARLHYLSPRWQNPFVTLNCAAVSESLMESELFGHESGAFTGAARQRTGRFERAHGGTLFLDEIGNMPLPMQEKILRVVEYGVFERVGGSHPVATDVRIIAATNVDLVQMANAGKFKRDLLDRLAFEVLTLPPLRARNNDALLLAQRFAASMATELGLPDTPVFSEHATQQLFAHQWPGNIRELKNTIDRTVFHADGDIIDSLELDPFVSPWRQGLAKQPSDASQPASQEPPSQRPQAPCPQGESSLPSAPPLTTCSAAHSTGPLQQTDLSTPLQQATRQLELGYLKAALERTRHNQREAAELLGLTYHQFRGLFRKHKQDIVSTA